MKIVFDSNIYISAFVLPGSQAERAITKVIEDNAQLIISKDIVSEILRILSTKFNRDKEALSRTALYLSDIARTVKPARKIKILKDDPDNRILECAVTGRAGIIVTGDKNILKLKIYEEVKIVSLKEFLERY